MLRKTIVQDLFMHATTGLGPVESNKTSIARTTPMNQRWVVLVQKATIDKAGYSQAKREGRMVFSEVLLHIFGYTLPLSSAQRVHLRGALYICHPRYDSLLDSGYGMHICGGVPVSG